MDLLTVVNLSHIDLKSISNLIALKTFKEW